MNPYLLYSMPVIGAVAGWIVHRIAIRRAVKTLLYKKKPEIATGIGRYVASEVGSTDKLTARLLDQAALDALRPAIASHVDSFLKVRLKEKIPVLSMFVGDSMLETIKEGLLEEIDSLLPAILGQYIGKIGEKIDIGKLVEEKIAAMSPEDLEQRIKATGALSKAALLGAFTGFVTGLIQVVLTLLQQ